MKKYIGFLILLSIFILGGAKVQAQEVCQRGDIYNSLTGQLCPVSNINNEFKVISPNGGETYQIGQSINIFLNGGLYMTRVGLVYPDFNPYKEINASNDVHWLSVSSNAGVSFVWDGVTFINNDGSISNYIVKQGQYKIVAIKDVNETKCYTNKISDCVFDMSDNYFKIMSQDTTAPSITVLSPNGGEIFTQGQQIPVKWETANIPLTSKMVINITNGSINSPAITTVNDGQEYYTIPKDFANGNDYILFVSTYSGLENYVVDNSDNFFTIKSQDSISPVTPIPVSKMEVGYLKPIGVSTTMWGSHTLTIESRQNCTLASCSLQPLSYLVKANDSSVLEGLKQFENSKVTIWGEAKYYNLEGGFWGITATKVVPVNTTVLPGCYASRDTISCPVKPMVCKDGCVCQGEMTICPIDPSRNQISRTLKVGTKGEDVKIIQSFLGAVSDGVFGQKTAEKVRNWQIVNGLSADGVVGRISLEKILENSMQIKKVDSCALGAKYSDKTGQMCPIIN